MKKSTWVIISLSFCVGALLILSGFLLVKYKSTDKNILQADGYFYLAYDPIKPLEGNINEGVGEIPSVIIPYRHSNELTYRAPLVTFDARNYEPIRSIIVKRFTPRGLSYSKNIQWKGIDLDSQKKHKFFLKRHYIPQHKSSRSQPEHFPIR